MERPHPIPRLLTEILVLAVVYFLAAELGLRLSFVRGNVTPVFPAAGVAVAALVLRGRALWPGVFVGALVAHLRTDVPVGVAFVMSGGAPLAAVVAASVLRSARLRFDRYLGDVRSTVVFLSAGVCLPALIAATWGVTTLVVGDVVPSGEFATSWWVWCVGDALGAVVAGSLLLAWSGRPGPAGRRGIEMAALTLGAVLAAGVLFFFADDGEVLLLPLLVLVAVRLESRFAMAVVFAVALLAASATASGRGPFADADVHASLVALSVFLAAGTLTALVLGAAVAERDRAQRRLAAVNDDLERRVDARTQDLAASRARLQAVVEHLTEAVAILDAAGTVQFANPAAELLLGSRPGQPFLAAAIERSGARPTDRAAKAMEGWQTLAGLGALAQFTVTLPDGGVRHVEAVGENLIDDPLLRGVVVTARDVTGHELRARTLWEQARRDILTGLPNRRRLAEELATALERRLPVAVIFADLDGLKAVNDTFGHTGGDALLAAVGARLQAGLRSGDLAARLAGDEFTILAYGIASTDAALAAGHRMLRSFDEPYEVAGVPVQITASIGIALGEGGDPEALLQVADAAMYEAKRAGGGRVSIAPGGLPTG